MMNKVNMYVCENYFPEFKRVCEKNGLTDVTVIPFPSTCVDKGKKAEAASLFAEGADDDSKGLVLCSRNCDVCNLIPKISDIELHPADYCFSHLASEPFIEYVFAKGGYIIGSGWLKNWRQRIADAGFDQETARYFYQDFCQELVFFDAGIDTETKNQLNELSLFLELPFVIIPVQMEHIQLIVNSALAEHQLHKNDSHNRQAIADIQAQCAEYAAIFDIMGRISSYSNKRDVIEKVKEIFMMMFGAQHFKYWHKDDSTDDFPKDIEDLLLETDREFLLSKEENRFCIKIMWHEKLFGVIDVKGFMFPVYIEKYLNFALEITKICGLVFQNNEQYEKILKSEQDFRYMSTHDSLTDLYNRAYINEIFDQQTQTAPFTVFMFDIDKLKFVNDHYGHAQGDKLIISMASILKKSFREDDIVARIGGDEFVAILLKTNEESVDLILNRIRQQVESYNSSQREDYLKISFSTGYATGDKPKDTIETTMHLADDQMYKDKSNKQISKIV